MKIRLSIILSFVLFILLSAFSLLASIGLGEWETDLCDDFVHSNSDIYQANGAPVLLIRQDKQVEIILTNVYQVVCKGDFIIGSFWPNGTSEHEYFLLNKTSKAVEKFNEAKSLNDELLTLKLIPFYGKPIFKNNYDVFQQLETFRFIKWTFVFIILGIVLILLKVLRDKRKNNG